MSDVFISYSAKDTELARWLYDQLTARRVRTFLAEICIEGGKDWKPEILQNLKNADFVLFLATPNSCRSDAVKHEIGGALILSKTFVPIMAGVSAKDLPAWVQDKQAVDIYDGAKTSQVFEKIAYAVTSKRFVAGLIVGILAAAAIFLLGKKK